MDWQEKVKYFDFTADDMECIMRLNNAINYVENHLSADIDYEETAKCACFSLYHFKRLFAFIVGIPISEYIRRRRLTLAAFDLQTGGEKVIDVALRYRYDSPTSFCRAFKSMHGVNPSAVRSKGTSLKAYPRVAFQISVKGDTEMNYRIEQRESFEVFGVKTIIKNREAALAVPQFWAESRADGAIARIKQAAGVTPETPIHAALYECTDEQYTYLLCMPLSQESCPEEFTTLSIPDGEWAVFTTGEQTYEEMSAAAAKMWKEIFTEWFAMSGYELVQATEMEMHYQTGSGKYIAEIWIPVTKK